MTDVNTQMESWTATCYIIIKVQGTFRVVYKIVVG
jgi:hypothetical protein